MRLTAALVGNLEQYMAEEVARAETAVMSGLAEGVAGLKGDLRAQVTGAGLGQRLANSWRGKVYPEWTKSINAAALVWTEAPKLIDAFDRGVLIRAKDGPVIAIPTPAAGTVRGAGKQGRLTPEIWQRRTGLTLRLVKRKGSLGFLVADGARINSKGAAVMLRSRKKKEGYYAKRNQVTAIIFILVPQANLRKRLNVKPIAEAWESRLPGLVMRNWK